MAQLGLVLQHSPPKKAAPSASGLRSSSLRKIFDKLSLSLTREEILEILETFDKLQQSSREDLHRLVRDCHCPCMLFPRYVTGDILLMVVQQLLHQAHRGLP